MSRCLLTMQEVYRSKTKIKHQVQLWNRSTQKDRIEEKKKSHEKEKLIALCESSVQSREVPYEMKTPTRFSFVLMLADSMDPIVFLKCLISWAFLFLKKRKVLRKLTYNLEMHCHVNIRRVFSSFIQGKIKWALSYTIRDNPIITSKLQSFTVFEYGT